MKFFGICALFAALLIAGCTTTTTVQNPPSHLPPGAEVVGGGLLIDWDTTQNGTAILMEVKSGKIVRTESLKTGDRFSFNSVNDDSTYVLNRLFSSGPEVSQTNHLLPLPADAQFLLYFVPAKNI